MNPILPAFNTTTFKPVIFSILSLLALAFYSGGAQAQQPLATDSLIIQRLELMKPVAAYKWLHKKPIEDLERERLVLKAAVEQGLRAGIQPQSAEAFFQAQIVAAKQIQTYWFSQWQQAKQAKPESAPDLQQDLRPKLIVLGQQIIDGLAKPPVNTDRTQLNRPEGLSADSFKQLLSAANVERFEHRLDQILKTKVLRVGTTGDYAPFSSDVSSGAEQLNGIDIELAENLAAALGVNIQWVKTSWPTLMADLQAGEFDIGMSGISKNLQRARVAYFSPSYQVGGKAAIVRCKDTHKFNSLENIDQAGVRVVVNPGGTNHRFVNSNIKQAEVLIHNDNRTIFQQLVQNKADVMITDHVEVLLQSANNKALCPAPMGLLSHSEKAYLLPQDEALLHYVTTWLELKKNDGTVAAVKQKYLKGL